MGSVIYIRKRNILTQIEYGLLYNWYAATYSTGGASIAPPGWHVPTNAEILTLETYISDDVRKLKEIGTIYWNVNVGATNEYGFSARGSGERSGSTGAFTLLTNGMIIWTSTIHANPVYAYYSAMTAATNTLDTGNPTAIDWGCAIRLLKNDSTDPGTIADYDGNIYPTVKIGSQVWMAQNLMVTHFNDGTLIPWHGATPASYFTNAEWAALTTAGVCAYGNILSNVATGFTFP